LEQELLLHFGVIEIQEFVCAEYYAKLPRYMQCNLWVLRV